VRRCDGAFAGCGNASRMSSSPRRIRSGKSSRHGSESRRMMRDCRVGNGYDQGSMDMWICGYVDMWICGYVDVWMNGRMDIQRRTSPGHPGGLAAIQVESPPSRRRAETHQELPECRSGPRALPIRKPGGIGESYEEFASSLPGDLRIGVTLGCHDYISCGDCIGGVGRRAAVVTTGGET
jgi:hypothetical protein